MSNNEHKMKKNTVPSLIIVRFLCRFGGLWVTHAILADGTYNNMYNEAHNMHYNQVLLYMLG